MGVIAETDLGQIEGKESNGVYSFRGLPFAAPPVGRLRFSAPEPHAGWEGTFDGTMISPSALQPPELSEMPGMNIREMDENCLYLNVWTPGLDGERRPVMVWIHGGGFVSGAGTLPVYKGERLSAEGDVVVVTINYRLGALGFLHLKDVLEDFEADSNLGLRDQIAALEWVRDNVASFGGDPSNVTVFGESAGAMSIATLMGMPKARGLFHKAILQSGAAHNVFDAAQASGVAAEFCQTADIRPESPEALRTMDARKILDHQVAIDELSESNFERRGTMLAFQPVTDSASLPAHPLEAIRRGDAADIPILIGTTAEEFKLFTLRDPGMGSLDRTRIARRIAKIFRTDDEAASEIVEVYEKSAADRGEDSSPESIWVRIGGDAVFRVPAIRFAEAHSESAVTYMYVFSHSSPMLGASHGIDVPFVFGNLGGKVAEPFLGPIETTEALSRKMRHAWVSFARDGHPAADDLPDWPEYSKSTRSTMILDSDPRTVDDYRGDERKAWNGVV